MSEQENVQTAVKLFDDLNAHNVRSNDDLYAAGYKLDGPGAPGPMNLEQSRMYLEGFLDAFPDLNFKIKKTIADGDMVAVVWEATGTHTGPMRTPTGASIPATGKKGNVSGCTTYEFMGSKVASSSTYWDMVTLLTQLGLMPSM